MTNTNRGRIASKAIDYNCHHPMAAAASANPGQVETPAVDSEGEQRFTNLRTDPGAYRALLEESLRSAA